MKLTVASVSRQSSTVLYHQLFLVDFQLWNAINLSLNEKGGPSTTIQDQ